MSFPFMPAEKNGAVPDAVTLYAPFPFLQLQQFDPAFPLSIGHIKKPLSDNEVLAECSP